MPDYLVRQRPECLWELLEVAECKRGVEVEEGQPEEAELEQ